jgi:hypothetical protein
MMVRRNDGRNFCCRNRGGHIIEAQISSSFQVFVALDPCHAVRRMQVSGQAISLAIKAAMVREKADIQ